MGCPERHPCNLHKSFADGNQARVLMLQWLSLQLCLPGLPPCTHLNPIPTWPLMQLSGGESGGHCHTTSSFSIARSGPGNLPGSATNSLALVLSKANTSKASATSTCGLLKNISCLQGTKEVLFQQADKIDLPSMSRLNLEICSALFQFSSSL
eukprot:6477255-Amphidinium_carterae.1